MVFPINFKVCLPHNRYFSQFFYSTVQYCVVLIKNKADNFADFAYRRFFSERSAGGKGRVTGQRLREIYRVEQKLKRWSRTHNTTQYTVGLEKMSDDEKHLAVEQYWCWRGLFLRFLYFLFWG